MGALCTPATRNQTVSQQTILPQSVQDAVDKNLSLVDQIASQPYNQYTQPRIAPFSNATQQAFNLTSANTGAFKPYLDRATNMLDRAAQPITASDISPYTTAAIDPAIKKIQQAGAVERRGINDEATAAGAFGDARHGVAEGVQRRGETDSISQIVAQMMDQAYQQAQADKNRMLTTAPLYSSMGDTASTQGLRDAAAMAGVGAQQEAKTQSSLDLQYQDFLRQLGYPQEMLNLRTSTLSGTPYPSTTVKSGDVLGTSPIAQATGLAIAAPNLYSMFFKNP